jgi:hypothetical protein
MPKEQQCTTELSITSLCETGEDNIIYPSKWYSYILYLTQSWYNFILTCVRFLCVLDYGQIT